MPDNTKIFVGGCRNRANLRPAQAALQQWNASDPAAPATQNVNHTTIQFTSSPKQTAVLSAQSAISAREL